MSVSLVALLLAPFAGGVLVYLGGLIHRTVRFAVAVLVSLLMPVLIAGYYGSGTVSLVYGRLFSSSLVLQMNPLTWLLAIVITAIFLMSVLFSIPEMEETAHVNAYYLELLFLEGAMLGIVLAGDLFTFFVFWEMMSWTSYFLVIKGTSESSNAGYKYILMSLVGANAALVALALVYLKAHSFVFADVSGWLALQSPAFVVSVFVHLDRDPRWFPLPDHREGFVPSRWQQPSQCGCTADKRLQTAAHRSNPLQSGASTD